MSKTGRSPLSNFALGRRSLLFGATAAAVMATAGPAGWAAASQGDEPPPIDFDLDTDNYFDWLVPQDEDAGTALTSEYFGQMDVTTFLWLNRIAAIAAFDAVAPYHETAVGIHTRIRRRPSSESATNRNMNTASLYAALRVMQYVLGSKAPDTLGQVMSAIGLDPDDRSEDPASPVGIGNLAGKGAFEAHKRDGMNFLGDEGRRYNPRPWADYTGYRPVNTAFDLANPSRWQPQLGPHNGRRVGGGPGDIGIYVAQHMVTPQMGRVRPLSFRDPGDFPVARPDFSDHTRPRAYRRAVDEVLAASAALTDEQKVFAEIMDNKLWGIGQSGVAILRKHDRNGEQGIHGWVHFQLEHVLATFESAIVAWHHKVRYDAVRPVSAVRHVYGSRPVTAWGGPGRGTVNDIPATEWRSYLPTGDHPEYPSGSALLCGAASQAARRYFGDDVLDWKFTVRAGGTRTEPGIAPAKDIEIHFPTWTDFTRTCADSRVWGGVHFQKTVDRSAAMGEQFGDLAHEFVQRHIRGEVRS